MRLQDPSSEPDNQFSLSSSAFISDSIPNTRIRLLRARPQTEAALARQLEIPRRLELLARQASPSSTAARLLQNDTRIGTTSHGASIHLVLTVVLEVGGEWHAGWFLAIIPVSEVDRWQVYLNDSREWFVREAGRQQGNDRTNVSR
jgi:hypothetical protein